MKCFILNCWKPIAHIFFSHFIGIQERTHRNFKGQKLGISPTRHPYFRIWFPWPNGGTLSVPLLTQMWVWWCLLPTQTQGLRGKAHHPAFTWADATDTLRCFDFLELVLPVRMREEGAGSCLYLFISQGLNHFPNAQLQIIEIVLFCLYKLLNDFWTLCHHSLHLVLLLLSLRHRTPSLWSHLFC